MQSLEPGEELVYPGTCRNNPGANQGPHALRIRINARLAEVGFEDRLQGPVNEHCHHTVFAYHLAVVVDDELQGVTEVVRGCDTPEYAHLPLLLETDGRKLAKSRHAVPLDTDRAAPTLWEALDWLRQDPPAELAGASVREIWAWALPNWRPDRLAGCRELRLP